MGRKGSRKVQGGGGVTGEERERGEGRKIERWKEREERENQR